MSDLGAAGLGQLALRLNLIDEVQLQDALAELDSRSDPPEALLRVLQRKGWVTGYQAGKLMRGETEGYFLGGYRLLYKIASGTFGRVFRADDPRTGAVVAVKVLRRRWLDDKYKVELFEREGKVGLSLRQPNIVEVLAVNRDPVTGQYYIVMEFVEGGNLRDILIRRKKLEVPEALRILEEAAAGLSYAYSKGFTHRDIKQTNILLSVQGVAKLVDFGLAEIAAGADLSDPNDTEIARTVDYAGLERATGVKQGDVRSDIYFLGWVFYEMVTGRRLVPSTRDRTARMARQRFEVLEKVRRDAAGELPPMVLSLIEKMVALEPSARFQTPSQLLEAVQTIHREITGGGHGAERVTGPRTVFVVEGKEHLMDAFREKLKELGYRVLLSFDPNRAAERFDQSPYHGLILDAGTVGQEGLAVFDRVMQDAELKGFRCGGIVILAKNQAHWADQVRPRRNVAVLVQPVTMKQLCQKLQELVPLD
ncbi:MAG TPA: serine/threonine-protein kinase [Gemmataceae bacterium]